MEVVGKRCIRTKNFEVFTEELKVIVYGQLIPLTAIEMLVLCTLIKYRGETVRRGQLLTEIWRSDEENTNIVAVSISRLRRKIEKDPKRPQFIISVRSIGYKFIDY